MLSKGNVVPSLRNANLTQVAEAMRVGPAADAGVRPRPDERAADVGDRPLRPVPAPAVATPAVSAISHFGPVAEGFVGVIVGFGILLFAVR